jgi:hypothetical protein
VNTESSAFGWDSQANITDGDMNTTVGINTLGTSLHSHHVIAIGTDAMRNGNASSNTAIGVSALKDDNVGFNTVIGDQAYQSNLSAAGAGLNIVIGWQTFQGLSGTALQKNVIIGSGIGQSATTLQNSVVIGHQAGGALTTQNNVTAVGTQAAQNLIGNGSVTALGANAAQAATNGQRSTIVGKGVGSVTYGTGSGGTGDGVILIGSGKLTVDSPAAGTSNWMNVENAIIQNTVAPTISSGFGSTPAIPNGTSSASFEVNVGTGGVASSGIVAFATGAPHGWACTAVDKTNPATANTVATPASATTITLTNYSRTTGLAAPWAASDIIVTSCNGY